LQTFTGVLLAHPAGRFAGDRQGSRNNPIRPDCIQRFLAEAAPVLADADERRRLLDMDLCCVEPVPMLVSTAEIRIN